MAGLTYPLFAHWAWGGGWLSQLGIQFGMGRGYLDAGGAGCIQVTGGLTALSIAWILGPRRGKYPPSGMAAAIPGHHTVFVLLSCFLAWFGWTGLNASGALLFAGVAPGTVVLIAVNTMLSAGMSALAAAVITRTRFGRPDASLCANGWVGGLVASSAGCAFMAPAVAALSGLVAGALITLSVEWIDMYLGVDDPGGSISVHAIAGVWGLLALGMFGHVPAGQWLAQLVGVATLFGFVLPLAYTANWLLNRFLPQRVSPEGEWQGMDLHELGAGAYPEFVIHREDFIQR
jgi:Amt family ammonium transporter